MSTCKICKRKLKCGDETTRFSSHLTSNRCLKVTNDLWYERDLLLQKIQTGDDSKETFEEHKKLDDLHKSYIKYREYKTAKSMKAPEWYIKKIEMEK